ncbi:MAG: acyl-CoA thioesterase [Flavobacteriaceae bacterium]|nr:acyl-CoA thioesterase [Bacteroidia bacterium]NNF74744.1 acyl-CoA thioesterase [Flavobacteriaceae bacterium]NNK73005.1 acyl-CoA thioesterase [Flavobacteriaceae bacterium]
MPFYTHTVQVERSDLDDLNHVNNVRYVQWIQDIAKAHWESEATDKMRSDYFWVVIRHTIDYKSSAVLYDYINIRTFVQESSGVTSTRIVEMFHAETDSLIVRSETVWCLIDAKSKRPTRITDEIVELFK